MRTHFHLLYVATVAVDCGESYDYSNIYVYIDVNIPFVPREVSDLREKARRGESG